MLESKPAVMAGPESTSEFAKYGFDPGLCAVLGRIARNVTPVTADLLAKEIFEEGYTNLECFEIYATVEQLKV